MCFTHTQLSLQITLIGLMGRLIKGHIFYHHTISDTTDLILMKVGGLIWAVFWHLTFLILIGSMGTVQYNKRPHFQDLKGHNCHSSRSEFDEMLKDDATCSIMAKGIFVLFMRYSMFIYIEVQMCFFYDLNTVLLTLLT